MTRKACDRPFKARNDAYTPEFGRHWCVIGVADVSVIGVWCSNLRPSLRGVSPLMIRLVARPRAQPGLFTFLQLQFCGYLRTPSPRSCAYSKRDQHSRVLTPSSLRVEWRKSHLAVTNFLRTFFYQHSCLKNFISTLALIYRKVDILEVLFVYLETCNLNSQLKQKTQITFAFIVLRVF